MPLNSFLRFGFLAQTAERRHLTPSKAERQRRPRNQLRKMICLSLERQLSIRMSDASTLDARLAWPPGSREATPWPFGGEHALTFDPRRRLEFYDLYG